MILMIPIAVIIAVLVGFAIDRLQVGGSGIWYGYSEPPEDFVGFWDKGDIVVQWPEPGIVRYEDLVVDSVHVGSITANGISSGDIVVKSISSEDMIADPDYPGMITTKQELARRREEEK